MSVTEIDPAAVERARSTGVLGLRGPTIVRGEGARLFDADGRSYVDCTSGHGVAAIGHGHPRWAEAVARQAATLTTLFPSFANDRRAALLERWAARTPPGLDRFFLCNSGAEAVEAAIKFARLATGRPGVVAAVRGFHGRTLGALSATWEPRYRRGLEPLVPEFAHAPLDRVDAWRDAVSDRTAAVIVEVVQGEGGVRPASAEGLAELRALCDERGAMLILDEVQTGFGRTGRFLACEHSGVVPDLLCLGKAIAGGVPMGAVAVGPRVGALPVGSHGSTFGGNPLACAAALAALDVLEEERLVERAAEEGERALARLSAIDAPRIREVRGLGLMLGVELKERAAPFVRALEERGVLALAAGTNVLRLLPPLVIERADLDRAIDAVAEVLS
ncbi:MAG: aspartate aminotransferase family protein [Planctomycetota bacterium JB042]